MNSPKTPIVIDHHCLEKNFFKEEDPTFEQKEWMYDVHDENTSIYSIILELRRSNAAAQRILDIFDLCEKEKDPMA